MKVASANSALVVLGLADAYVLARLRGSKRGSRAWPRY